MFVKVGSALELSSPPVSKVRNYCTVRAQLLTQSSEGSYIALDLFSPSLCLLVLLDFLNCGLGGLYGSSSSG